MKRQFNVVITREGEGYVARCSEVANAVGHGGTKEEALARLKKCLGEKLRPNQDDEEAT
jgi:predicted RNase H-like HicB family nuclease